MEMMLLGSSRDDVFGHISEEVGSREGLRQDSSVVCEGQLVGVERGTLMVVSLCWIWAGGLPGKVDEAASRDGIEK